MACTGEGFVGQGYNEDVPAVGYDDWKEGARIGVEFALAAAKIPSAQVVVRRIGGLTSDTTPAAIALAAALAVWECVEFGPSVEMVQRMEDVVFNTPLDGLPVFE